MTNSFVSPQILRLLLRHSNISHMLSIDMIFHDNIFSHILFINMVFCIKVPDHYYPLLAFSNKVQSHVMEGHEELEHMICHGSTEVQDVMCQQQSGDPEHMMEIEALLADWLGE